MESFDIIKVIINKPQNWGGSYEVKRNVNLFKWSVRNKFF